MHLMQKFSKYFVFALLNGFYNAFLYFTRNRITDFEGAVWILCLRYWHHLFFYLCIIVKKEMSSHFGAIYIIFM